MNVSQKPEQTSVARVCQYGNSSTVNRDNCNKNRKEQTKNRIESNVNFEFQDPTLSLRKR
jgi:hypothetical protein